MSLCINPLCPRLDHQENANNRFCQSCGPHLLLENSYRVMRLLSDKSGFGKIYEVNDCGGVDSVAISPNGQTLVIGGRDGTIKTWRVSR
ncbi:hypothetical protein SD81_021510 [Tolypothrix campylonemoides VB511288]|nr:hypothetical protein SD81_021510 [Tolypothrix campylonemoides VB511288]